VSVSVKPVIAVTGGGGFTGSALVKRLLSEGYSVRALVRHADQLAPAADLEVVVGRLEDGGALSRLVSGADTVFHIAAMFRTEGSLDEFLKVNYDGTMALLAAAKAAGVRRFVYCSTIGVHGSVSQIPSDETSPFGPMDYYQETKLKAELACRAPGAADGIEMVVVRPCSIYGPGDVRLLKMFRMVQKGLFLFVGDGRPNFHPVYIDDLVEGFMLAMTTPEADGEVFIIGAADYVPLWDFVGTAARAVGASPPKRRIPFGLMDVAARLCEAIFIPLGISPPLHRRRLSFFSSNRSFSIDKARRMLGYQPKVDLEEGFRRTVQWYYDQGLLKPKN
jgi:dihydroflavonol-4-reductase